MVTMMMPARLKVLRSVYCALALFAPAWVLAGEVAPDAAPAKVLPGEVEPEPAPATEAASAAEAKQAPEARPLATVEAILAFCSRIDPAAAQRYRERAEALSQGVDEETLLKVRESNEYVQAHGEVDEFLAKVDQHNARKVCAQHLGQNP